MQQLFLEDFTGKTEAEVVSTIKNDYKEDGWEAEQLEAFFSQVDGFEVLIAYCSEGSWGCDSSSFFLIRDRKTNKLYEVHGSHCSCYGFEGQWSPEEVGTDYLVSDKFHFSCGGYDRDEMGNEKKVKQYLQNNFGPQDKK